MDLVKEITKIKEYAKINNIPIMFDDGMQFLCEFIKDNHIKNILEIGTAIGYSAINMALCSSDIKITSLERDEKRYNEAVKNIETLNLTNQIELIYCDALEYSTNKTFDLIFIDAAKSQSIKFFEDFSNNLNDNGFIITDNMNFHGLVNKNPEEIESRNVRGLTRKIRDYKEFLINNKKYNTKFYSCGDGISVSKKINN